MSERRPYSPNDRGEDWSDEEHRRRDRFRRDRSTERDRSEDMDRYESRRRTRRSDSPSDEHRSKRRQFSPSPPSRRFRDREPGFQRDGGDHYVPNYDRDGYNPRPRYEHSSKDSQRYLNTGYMDRWSSMPRMRVDLDQLDRMVTFQEFCQEYRHTQPRGRHDDDELQRRYSKYKDEFTVRQLPAFFENNKDKQWFQERYHPQLSVPRQEDVNGRRRHNLQEFLEKLEHGEFDSVQYDKEAQPESSADENTTEEEQETLEKHKSPLVIKSVPPTMPRQSIIDMCSKVDGYEYIAMSEPNPTKKFHRICWIHFKDGTDMEEAFNKLDKQKVDDFTFHLGDDKKLLDRKPKNALEFVNSDRLRVDQSQTQRLAKTLDKEVGIEKEGLPKVIDRVQQIIAEQAEAQDSAPENAEDVEIENLKKELDLVLLYLRNVHMFCYYCGLQFDSSEELSRRCMEPHCRTLFKASTDGKQAERDERRALLRLKELDQRIRLKIHEPEELERLGGKMLEDEFAKEHILKEHEAKYKCKVRDCVKAFKGFDFVLKHIQSKHPEEFESVKEQVQYYNNYACDPNRLLPTSNTSGSTNTGASQLPLQGHGRMMPLPTAPIGTSWDQIPRLGFDGPRHDQRNIHVPLGSVGFDDPHSRNSRQLKSYVDLDAPAEGDADISFY